ncbi:MAG: 30S ribosomal protein S17 [Phycisphaeraceae bacterium]|nr:MAG: 30S ribosomal protein S17 [Phycisphaeraceae bacterium]
MATSTKTSTKGATKGTTGTKPAASDAAARTGTKTGVVDSAKRHKTRTVVISFQSKHPKYGKYIGQRTILQVHDEHNVSKTGDVVEIAPCRPMSKTKSWSLVRVVDERSDIAAAVASAKEIK